jgi:hypothetical protein
MSVIWPDWRMTDLLAFGTELLSFCAVAESHLAHCCRWVLSRSDIWHAAAAVQAPLLVEQGLLRSMEHALWRDTSFLAGLGVMDYSLLVGECAILVFYCTCKRVRGLLPLVNLY